MTDDLIDKVQELVSDEEVAAAFEGTNFGVGADPREIIADTLLKISGDYGTSYTSIVCCTELGLLGEKTRKLTARGRRYLYHAHAKMADRLLEQDAEIKRLREAADIAQILISETLPHIRKNKMEWFFAEAQADNLQAAVHNLKQALGESNE